MGINLVVIRGVVLVNGWCREDRVQVEGCHPQGLQVVEFAGDCIQITAIEGGASRLFFLWLIPVAAAHPALSCLVLILPVLNQIGAGSRCEAVREDLIEDLIGNPGWMAFRLLDAKLAQPLDGGGADPLRAKPAVMVMPDQLEAVPLPG